LALGSKHAITEIFLQDPRFNSLDEVFLKSLDMTVVPDPKAFEAIGATTFAYIPHGELEVTGKALAGQPEAPAVYIGNVLDLWIDSMSISEERKAMVMPFRQTSTSVNMPQPEGSSWCNNTRIYWKPTDTADSD